MVNRNNLSKAVVVEPILTTTSALALEAVVPEAPLITLSATLAVLLTPANANAILVPSVGT